MCVVSVPFRGILEETSSRPTPCISEDEMSWISGMSCHVVLAYEHVEMSECKCMSAHVVGACTESKGAGERTRENMIGYNRIIWVASYCASH